VSVVEFRPRARIDLAEIYRYSRDTFGEDQADVYFAGIEQISGQLASGVRSGKPSTFRPKTFQTYHHQSHVIVFVKIPDGIRVVRILHDLMDYLKHMLSEDM
jgi:toxin ParE1/3/4